MLNWWRGQSPDPTPLQTSGSNRGGWNTTPYRDTAGVDEARRYIGLQEASTYRCLSHEVTGAEQEMDKFKELARSLTNAPVQQLQTLKAISNARLRRRRVRVDFRHQFRPLKRLARGERSQPWLVHDRIVDQRLVVKIFHRRDLSSAECLDMIREQRRRVLGHNHPNLCQLRAVFTPRDNPNILCLASAYCRGDSMATLLCALHPTDLAEAPNTIRFRRPEEASAMDLGHIDRVTRFLSAEILNGLVYLHARGIDHGDLKPENVVLMQDGHARLTDFGISGRVNLMHLRKYYEVFNKHYHDGNNFASGLTSNATRLANWSGHSPFRIDVKKADGKGNNLVTIPQVGLSDRLSSSALYAPPETFRMSGCCGRFERDYWALGVLIYMCYCGGNPFLRQSRYANENSALLHAIAETIDFRQNPYLEPTFIANFAPKVAVSLIGRLLTDKSERLGRPLSGRSVLRDVYFRWVNFKTLPEKRSPIQPLFKEDIWLTATDMRLWDSYSGISETRDESKAQFDLLADWEQVRP